MALPKTVFITGASSGIGRATVRLFSAKGWRVAATMRSPEKETKLQKLPGVICFRLDVTDPPEVQAAISDALNSFRSIDVVVNNAGYGLVGPFERFSREQLVRQFETNVLGLMDVTRTALPALRLSSGIIINIASIGGRVTFPFYSVYHATKWGIEGFSEALGYELDSLGVRVKIVEPGPIKTDFYGRSAEAVGGDGDSVYGAVMGDVTRRMDRFVAGFASEPDAVAQVIYRAATDGKKRLRYPAGWAAFPILLGRRLLPFFMFQAMVRQVTLGCRRQSN